MASVSTNIRIDTNVKKQSTELLNGLGLSLSDAVNMFLHQVILNNGLPFEVKYPAYSNELQTAVAEAVKISRDSSVKGYTDMTEMWADIES